MRAAQLRQAVLIKSALRNLGFGALGGKLRVLEQELPVVDSLWITHRAEWPLSASAAGDRISQGADGNGRSGHELTKVRTPAGNAKTGVARHLATPRCEPGAGQ